MVFSWEQFHSKRLSFDCVHSVWNHAFRITAAYPRGQLVNKQPTCPSMRHCRNRNATWRSSRDTSGFSKSWIAVHSTSTAFCIGREQKSEENIIFLSFLLTQNEVTFFSDFAFVVCNEILITDYTSIALDKSMIFATYMYNQINGSLQMRECHLSITLVCIIIGVSSPWLNARLWYLQCISNGDTTVVH